jgi:1-acyl-sn-glycerol-3-phosphate acyltransferase
LFIQRDQKSDVVRVNAQLATVLEQGLVLAIFPEGTSTDGNTLLPFRSSLLAPATERGWPVTPTWIGYSLDDGRVEEEICYWRDMTFGLHALNLLSKRGVTVRVAYAASIEPGPDRKELARQLHAQVCELAERYGGRNLRGSPVTQ